MSTIPKIKEILGQINDAEYLAITKTEDGGFIGHVVTLDPANLKAIDLEEWKKPLGWKGLKFENIGEDEATITLAKNRTDAPDVSLMYSMDAGETWNDFVVCSSTTSLDGTIITLPSGFGVCFKAGEGGNITLATSTNKFNRFVMSGSSIKASGNINSLLDGENFEEIDDLTGRKYCFKRLFYGCTSLNDVSELQLPAITLVSNCYCEMFNGCASLTQAPELPATTLAADCYNMMFYGCTSLTQAPELPATNLASYCYFGMFSDCTSLTQAPNLPATTLTDACYNGMFYNCTSLTQAPELPATTLDYECYCEMFSGCKSLTQAPELPATTLADYCYKMMFYGCKKLTQAPELPATTVTTSCYDNMFYYCTPVKRVKMNASSCGWGSTMFIGCTSLELVDMTGSIGVPQLQNANNFSNTNNTYKIVVPDSLYDTWITATNWSSASIKPHIMKQSDWNSAHPDDILGQ